jgi:hypothetical protein
MRLCSVYFGCGATMRLLWAIMELIELADESLRSELGNVWRIHGGPV